LILQGPVGGLTPPSNPASWFKILMMRAYLSFILLMWHCFGKEHAIEFVNRYGYQTHGYYPLLVSIQKKVHPKALYQLAMNITYPPYIGNLHCVKSPALIISGQDDITPRRYYTYIQNHIDAPCLLVSIPRARHIVSLE